LRRFERNVGSRKTTKLAARILSQAFALGCEIPVSAASAGYARRRARASRPRESRRIAPGSGTVLIAKRTETGSWSESGWPAASRKSS